MKQKPFEVKPVDFEILKLVKAYHFVTVNQLLRLRGLSNNSLSTEQPRLKKLADNKYLDRRHLPHTSTGNTMYVYSLSTKGLNYLKETGLIDSSRYRRDIIINVKYPHLDHALALNDFLIAARLLEKTVPSI